MLFLVKNYYVPLFNFLNMGKILIGIAAVAFVTYGIYCIVCCIVRAVWTHRFTKQISRMSLSEKERRYYLLYDELEDRWSLKGSVEYQVLLRALKEA